MRSFGMSEASPFNGSTDLILGEGKKENTYLCQNAAMRSRYAAKIKYAL